MDTMDAMVDVGHAMGSLRMMLFDVDLEMRRLSLTSE